MCIELDSPHSAFSMPLNKYSLIRDLDTFPSMNQVASWKACILLNAARGGSPRLLFSALNPWT